MNLALRDPVGTAHPALLSVAAAAAPDLFDIVLASPQQTPAVLALLPDLLRGQALPPQGALLAHRPGRPSQVLGAAALLPAQAGGTGPGFGLLVQVLPGWRRQGIGTRLLARLAAQARAWQVDHLHRPAVADGSTQAAWLAALGFRPGPATLHFRIPVAAALAQGLHLQQALMQQRRVPAGVVVRPLHQAPLAAVAALASSAPQHAGRLQDEVRAHLDAALRDEVTRAQSVALMSGQRLCGLLLAGQRDSLPLVDQWVIAPDLQTGWPEVLMLTAFLQQAQSWGHREACFHCPDDHLAPQHIARKSGAVCEAVRRGHSLAL